MAPSLEVGCDGVVLHAAMASRLDLPPLWAAAAAARGDQTLLLRYDSSLNFKAWRVRRSIQENICKQPWRMVKSLLICST
ncbi:hypothetical protein C2845_PM18G13320 [Panicum miliaceum]|uniref:Uncharacterized protein n=1 Tax=Panicum miliaceum TaxID=4540 RepID=A0A3L6PH35_PANMI|nr:hypothetical protein C2845_PM18G13320 [Panicum miliaceum]